MRVVVQVRPAEEATAVVEERHLGFRTRQSSEDKNYAQPRFHHGFRRGFSQVDRSPQEGDSTVPSVFVDPGVQVAKVEQTLMQRHVKGDHGLNQRAPATQISECANG